MSCELVATCKNNTKCYRCYDQSLYRDKRGKGVSKAPKVHTERVASSENSWEDLEQQVTNSLNNIPSMKEARRTMASGALPFEKGDVVDRIFHVECKERSGRELKSGTKSISIQKDWLEKAIAEGSNIDKIMLLPFRFKEDTKIYAIMEFEKVSELTGMLKAFMADDELKDEEIRLLREQLKILMQEVEP